MKTIITLFSLLILAGCLSGDRYYYIHNDVSDTSALIQTIKVDAVAAHPITVDANVPAPVLP